MIIDNLKLLDMDEHLRETLTKIHKERIDACKVLNLTLDLATSDVVCYVTNKYKELICIEDYEE